MTVYIIYLYPIPRDLSSYTLKLVKSAIIIYTSQNFKPLHRAGGSLVNPHYGCLVITSWRNCFSKFKVKRQRFIFLHPVTVSVVHTKPGFKCHYLTFFSLAASTESERRLGIVIHILNAPRRRLSTYR